MVWIEQEEGDVRRLIANTTRFGEAPAREGKTAAPSKSKGGTNSRMKEKLLESES